MKTKPGPTARELKLLRKDIAAALKATAINAQLAADVRHLLSQNDSLRAIVKSLQERAKP